MLDAQRERLANILAKFAEILFWLLVVGPFVAREGIRLPLWLALIFLLFICIVVSVRLSGSKGGNRQ